MRGFLIRGIILDMRKTISIIVITLIIMGVVSYLRYEVKLRLQHNNQNNTTPKSLETINTDKQSNSTGYKDSTYMLDGQLVTLTDGEAESEVVEGSEAKSITRYFGNEVVGDFNNDGLEDVAFLLSQETGGTGVFFYLVVALNTPAGYTGSHGYFIGDRIAPQSTQLGEGSSIIVNYADRAPGEPFATDPSVGKSVRLLLDIGTMTLREVVR